MGLKINDLTPRELSGWHGTASDLLTLGFAKIKPL
jgi:hypothetical protein